jgi:D-xylulose reductase
MLVFKLPENVSFDEGALAEPFAVGLHAARKAQIKPGDVALVIGAGTIGLVTAMAAIAGGCSQVIIADILQEKLDFASRMGMIAVNVVRESLSERVSSITNGWGTDIVFEASGSEAAVSKVFEPLCPGGRVVFIGMPIHPVPIDIVSAQVKEARIETIFRYAHVYPRALSLMEAGKVNVKPLVTDRYRFEESIAAFEYAANPKPSSIKILIEF